MIKVLFFGRLGDFSHGAPEHIELSEETATPEKIRTVLGTTNPDLHRELCEPQVLIAVNQQISDWQKRLKTGDEIAFLPPVTGG